MIGHKFQSLKQYHCTLPYMMEPNNLLQLTAALQPILDAALRPILNALGALNEKVAGLDERLAGLDERVAGLDEKVQVLDTKLTGLQMHLKISDAKAINAQIGRSELLLRVSLPKAWSSMELFFLFQLLKPPSGNVSLPATSKWEIVVGYSTNLPMAFSWVLEPGMIG